MKVSSFKNIKLELIRAIAALEVLINHSFGHNPSLKGKTWPNLFTNWATEAVIIFFILSGIVIHISVLNKPKNRGEFLYNRLLRIYPLYFVGIVLAVVSSIIVKEDFNLKMILGNLTFLGTFQQYIVPVFKTNAVIWSLSFEMFFYLVFALTIGRYQKLIINIWGIVSLICFPLYYQDYSGVAGHIVAMFAFSAIWLLGYYIVYLKDVFQKPAISQVFFFLSLLPCISRMHLFPPFYDVVKYFIFSLCAIPVFIYCLLPGKPVNKGIKITYLSEFLILTMVIAAMWLSSKSLLQSKIIYSAIPLVAFATDIVRPSGLFTFLNNDAVKRFSIFYGNLSYPVYILHYPLMVMFYYFVGNFSFIIQIPLSLFIVIVIVIFIEKYFQNPVIHFFNKRNNINKVSHQTIS